MQTINTNTTQNGQFAMNGSIQYITPHVNQSPNNSAYTLDEFDMWWDTTPIAHIPLYGTFKQQRHQVINEIIKRNGYTGNGRLILHEILKRTDQDGFSRASQASLAKALGISTKTIERWYKRYREDGILLYEKEGFGHKPYLTTMSCTQHLKPVKTDTESDNIKLSEDLDLNSTYTQYSSSPTNKIKYRKPTDSEKLVRKKDYESDPEAEIKRICFAWMLTEIQTCYVIDTMSLKQAKAPIGFLYTMVKGLSDGRWNMTYYKKEPKEIDYATNFKSRSIDAAQEILARYRRQEIDATNDRENGLKVLKKLKEGLKH
jgi:transposase